MNRTRKAGQFLLRFSWSAMLFLQLLWHALLSAPAGNENRLLALIALLPLLPLTRGVLKGSHRSLVLGTFVLMIYFIIGVMEAWSNSDQRAAALTQVILTCVYFAAVVLFNRPEPQAPD